MYLIYDTETTGLPKDYNAPITDAENWPRLVQLAWQVHAKDGSLIEAQNFIVQPDGFDIPFNSEQVHGISTKKALEEGIPLQEALDRFTEVLGKSQIVAGHNIEFDINIMGAEYMRMGDSAPIMDLPSIVTRFAPSPTGLLHLGHAYSALFSFEAVRRGEGRFLLRI